MKLEAIVCVDNNWGIGKENKLPWHIPDDLRWFKENTTGKSLILSRVTFDSMPLSVWLDRFPIVISRTSLETDIVEVVKSPLEALTTAEGIGRPTVVVGGSSIYKELADVITRLYLTKIDRKFHCDAFFPVEKYQLDPLELKKYWYDEIPVIERKEPISHTYRILRRRQTLLNLE